MRLATATINVFTMADLHHENDQGLVFDLVDDAVVTHPEAILIYGSFHVFNAGWAGVGFKFDNVVNNALLQRLRPEGFQLTFSSWRHFDAIRHGLPRQAELADQSVKRLSTLFPSFRQRGTGVFKVNLIFYGFEQR